MTETIPELQRVLQGEIRVLQIFDDFRHDFDKSDLQEPCVGGRRTLGKARITGHTSSARILTQASPSTDPRLRL